MNYTKTINKFFSIERHLLVLILIIFLEAIFFSFYGISRHYNYLTSINDLGHMDQAVWGILHGYPFLNSDVFNTAVSRMGIHFDPVLAFFSPLYFIFPNVIWLILAQAFFLPLTGLPVYFLAQQVTKSEQAAIFWAIACIFSPFMLSAAAWDFHPVSLAVPFIALAYLAVEKRNFLLLMFSCCFILLCKEHFGLLVIGFSLLWFLRYKRFSESLILFLLGGGAFVIVMKVLIPFFSPSGQHLMISNDLVNLGRYDWLGKSLEDILIKISSHPLQISHSVFISMEGWIYLILLFVPLLCLPILSPGLLLPGTADLLANFLSATSFPRSIFSYHSATLVPVFVVAAIYGSCRFSYVLKRALPESQALTIMVITMILSWAFFPFFSLPGSKGFWEPKQVISFYDVNYSAVRKIISPEMSLSVQANLGAHFTQRHEIYRYPEQVGEADVVLLHLESPTFRTQGKKLASLAHHLQMDPAEYLDSIRVLLMLDDYKHFVWLDPWLIFLKEEKALGEVNHIENRIAELELVWGLK